MQQYKFKIKNQYQEFAWYTAGLFIKTTTEEKVRLIINFTYKNMNMFVSAQIGICLFVRQRRQEFVAKNVHVFYIRTLVSV